MDKSYWISTVNDNRKKYEKLESEVNTSVCIIGGGLTGLTCAYYLVKSGVDVIVLEKDILLNHASGNTTAKITSQHGLFYKYLFDSIGERLAKQYLDSNEQAISNIRNIIKEEKIECDFCKQNSYVFTQSEKEIKNIKDEVNVVKLLGKKDVSFVENINLPEFNGKRILGAIEFQNQAQFNPCKYGLGLANAIEKYGGKIYENSKVINYKNCNDGVSIITEDGVVNTQSVVLATHYPIINFPGFYFLKMYQETSYIVGMEIDDNSVNGMYISAEKPTISVRFVNESNLEKSENKKLLLVGGMNHKTGAKKDLSDSYKKLEKIAIDMYPNGNVKYRWNTEDCISLDKIPYIGKFSKIKENIYVATGYKKWGMTTSNVAGNIIRDLILDESNPFEEVYRATRLEPIKNHEELGNMIKEASYSLVINKLKEEKDHDFKVKNGDGKIVEIDGHKIGVYKDENGKLYLLKPYCSHLGCELSWNNLEKTWDCPCHGSRFSAEGKALYDPAIYDLERLDVE